MTTLFVLILHFAGPPTLVVPATAFRDKPSCEALASQIRQAEPRVQAYCIKQTSV